MFTDSQFDRLNGNLERIAAGVESLVTTLVSAVETPTSRLEHIATAIYAGMTVNTPSVQPIREAAQQAVELLQHLEDIKRMRGEIDHPQEGPGFRGFEGRQGSRSGG